MPRTFKFKAQALRLLIQPYFGAINPSYLQNLSFYQKYSAEMGLTTCHYVERACHMLRSIIINNPDLPLEQICVTVTDHVLDIIDLLTRDLLITVCQAIRIVLESYVVKEIHQQEKSPCSNQSKVLFYESLTDGDPIVEKPALLAALLNCLGVIVVKFNIKSHEIAESSWTGTLTKHILKKSNLQPNVFLLSLKIFKFSHENYLEKRLSFFEEHGFYLKQIGPILHKALQDTNCEMQKGAIEVLTKMALVSQQKFLFYQQFFLEYKFLEIAFDILTAEESNLASELLTFLSATIRVDFFWENALSKKKLLDLGLSLIEKSKEPKVRSNAISFITELFSQKRSLPLDKFDYLTQTMSNVCLHDGDLKVKNCALEFWDQWIKYQLEVQGMVGEEFPDYTFSKKRRIVELTEEEIISRLHDAVDKLSQQGCLGVLLATIECESNFEVAKKAASILNDLKEILIKYNMGLSDVKDNTANGQEFSKTYNYFGVASNAKDLNFYNLSKEDKQKIFLTKLSNKEFLQTIFNFLYEDYVQKRKFLEALKSFDNAIDEIALTYKN